jgi:seryl-tRNA synthetase
MNSKITKNYQISHNMDIANFRDPTLLEIVKQSEISRFNSMSNLECVVENDTKWREASHSLQLKQTEYNILQKNIGSLRNGDQEIFKNAIYNVQELKFQIAHLEIQVTQYLAKRDNALNLIGNTIHQSVPISNSETDNVVLRTYDAPSGFAAKCSTQSTTSCDLHCGDTVVPTFPLLHHSDVMEKLGLFNFVAGARIAGHRGYFLKGYGVLLNQALIQYGIKFLCNRGYTPLQTPFMMTQEFMSKTAQLSEFNELLYSVGDSDDEDGALDNVSSSNGGSSNGASSNGSKNKNKQKKQKQSNEQKKYLIATSEQPISCYHQNEWIPKNSLPLMYAGYSTCFRKEAGAHGKDVKGLFRVHQFEKIEQFCITSPESSWEMLEKMVENSENFLKSLGISYRVVAIVSGALNDAAAKKYDIEGWFPHTKEYRELMSVSNCTDYQSRKLGIRYGFKEGKEKVKYVHMLNGTLCATERLMCCIAENYQTAGGMNIPTQLVVGGYFDKHCIEYSSPFLGNK